VKLTSRLALAGDILAISTAAAAGLAVYLHWGSREERGVHVAVSPGGLSLRGSY
jgi:hypothetical protein